MKRWIPSLVLISAVFLTYGNTLFHSFHFDDIPSILEKPWVRGLDKIPQFLFSFFQRPLVILSFNVNYAISGFEVWSYHVFNILFHAVAVLLVHRLARLGQWMVSPLKRVKNQGYPNFPLLAALVFAIHPLNTQSVTYISSRSSILATLFYLATLIFFFQWVLVRRKSARKPGGSGSQSRLYGVGYLAGAGLFLFLGMLSKEIIISLPAILFLFHYYFISKSRFGPWLKSQLQWILLISLPLTVGVFLKHFKGGGLLSASPTDFSASTYLLTQTFVIPFEYFRKMIFPFNLNIDPDVPILSDWTHLSNYWGILALIIYVIVWVIISRRSIPPKKSPEAMELLWSGFAMGWILITLLPTSSVVPLLDVEVEHRAYLPMVGFSILIAALLSSAIRRFRFDGGSHPILIRSVSVGVLFILIFFSAGAVARNAVWKDEVSLWADAKKKSPGLIRPYNNLGQAYDKLGNYDKAIAEFKAALDLNPGYFFALSNLGNIYGKTGNYQKAILYFEKALEQKPDYAPAHYNLGRALHLVKKPEEALEAYRHAIQYNPYFEQAMFNLANLALETGRTEEAIKNYLQFIEMQPAHSRAHFGLANAYALTNQFDLALGEYQKSADLDPAFLPASLHRANLEMQLGKMDAAIATYEKILSRYPALGGVHKNLGMIYTRYKNDPQKGVRHFREYLRLEPNAPDAERVRSVIAEISGKLPAGK